MCKLGSDNDGDEERWGGASDEQLWRDRARERGFGVRWPGIKGGSGSDILWSDMQLVVLA